MKKPNSILLQKFLFLTGIMLFMHFQVHAICNASFTYSVNNSTRTVSFTNTSTGTGLLYNWNFGNSTTSTAANPTKTYANYGSYLVCLYVHDSAYTCIDSFCTTITITNTCNAVFSNIADTSNYKKIYFTSPNTGSNLTFSWNFGDSGTSSLQNPTHIYANAGTYNVCLIVRKAYNGDTCVSYTCHSVVVAPPPACNAYFTHSIIFNTKTVTFTNYSTGTGLSYYWKFGDSTFSSLANPVKTYSNYGTYNVCLIVSNGTCMDSFCKSVILYTGTNGCNTNFSAVADSANRKMFHFNAQNSGANLSYYWTFGDTGTSTLKSPVHTYAYYGTYQVSLRVSKAYNGDTCTNMGWINIPVTGLCNANFFYTTDSANNKKRNFKPYLAYASNTSYYWNFGDSSTSTLYNPGHIYTNAGVYNVCLKVVQLGPNQYDTCFKQYCTNVTIGCKAQYTYTIDPANKLKVNFNNISTGSGLTYSWTFGNSTSSTVKNPQVTYAAAGTYSVCLTIHSTVDTSCNETKCLNITVYDTNACHAQFLFVRDTSNVLRVQFANTSTGDSLNSTWNFGDGSANSNLRNPDHTFPAAGTYYVCMNVSRSNPSCSSYKCDSVTVGSNPSTCNAQFYYSVNSTTKTIVFANVSSGSRLKNIWSFGDSTTSTIKNPVHTYANNGIYPVCLYVFDSANINCNDIHCVNISIVNTNNNCKANYGYYRDVSNLSILKYKFDPFTNFSPTNTSFIWTFGDGDSAMTKTPYHTYAAAGTYTVCLTVHNVGDSCLVSRCDSIAVYFSSGMAEQENGLELAKLYPNPFDENINLELNVIKEGKLKMTIYDITGKEHYSNEFILNRNQNHFVIETEQLAKGVYLIKLFSDGHSSCKKLIK